MKDFLKHLFTPQETNNHRPRILHNQILILFIAVIFSFSLLLPTFKESLPQVLGTSINIVTSDLLNLTNKKRQESGLKPLVLNGELNLAASMKAKDMFAKNYWAHNAPDGTTPWFFIKNVGYKYQYAGENLARGFTGSDDVVNAWMASPSHKENMMSRDYEEIGFAVEKGQLNGEETTLVVEMFGGKNANLAKAQEAPKSSIVPKQLVASIKSEPLVNTNVLTRNLSLLITLMFIVILILDITMVERRRIVRLVGHNLDHIFFLSLVLLFIIFVSRGIVL